MKRAALIALLSAFGLVFLMAGCEGCALFSPEGEASFSSGPSMLSVFSD